MLTVISLVIKALPPLPMSATASSSDQKQQWLREGEMRRETAERGSPSPLLAYLSLIVLLSRTDDVWVHIVYPDDVLYLRCLVFLCLYTLCHSSLIICTSTALAAICVFILPALVQAQLYCLKDTDIRDIFMHSVSSKSQSWPFTTTLLGKLSAETRRQNVLE